MSDKLLNFNRTRDRSWLMFPPLIGCVTTALIILYCIATGTHAHPYVVVAYLVSAVWLLLGAVILMFTDGYGQTIRFTATTYWLLILLLGSVIAIIIIHAGKP